MCYILLEIGGAFTLKKNVNLIPIFELSIPFFADYQRNLKTKGCFLGLRGMKDSLAKQITPFSLIVGLKIAKQELCKQNNCSQHNKSIAIHIFFSCGTDK